MSEDITGEPQVITPEEQIPEVAVPAQPVPRIYFWQHAAFLFLLSGFVGGVLTLGLYLCLNSSNKPQELEVELPEETSADFSEVLLQIKPNTAKPEDTLILQIWKAETDQEKYDLYKQLQQKYRNTPHFKSISKQLALLEHQKAELLKAEQQNKVRENQLKKQQFENKAMKAYSQALNSINTNAKLAALQEVVSTYPKTPAASKAQKMMANIDNAQRKAAQARKATEEARVLAQTKAKEQALESKIRPARDIFLGKYRAALRKWNTANAEELCKQLGSDKKIPELRPFANDCLDDVKAMQSLHRTLYTYFKKNLGGQIHIKVGKGSKMRGKLVKVTQSSLQIMVSGRFPQTVSYPDKLYYKTALEIYKDNSSPDALPVEVMEGILLYSSGETEKAVKAFTKAGTKDPRKDTHQLILRTEY